MAKRVAMVLSGCGFKDGSEIHESVLSILHVVKNGGAPVFFAPDIPQTQVINHRTGEAAQETRNVLVEAARIARGEIADIKTANAADFDALIFPGGFGAAANLCDFAQKGENCEVNSDVIRLAQDFHRQGKPIGAICIAPVIVSKIFGEENPKVTIGTDAGVAGKLESLGVKHVSCQATEHCVDADKKLVTTPAYMNGRTIAEVDAGIEKLVKDVLAMA